VRQAPSDITPWHGPARPFSFRREVQPVLDRLCIGCHDGTHEGRPDFRGGQKSSKGFDGYLAHFKGFDASYLALMSYVRRPGPESDVHVLTPLDYHVGTSELFQMLHKGHHGVVLDDEAWDRLTTWVDLNVPCFGTWTERWGARVAAPHALRCAYRKKYADIHIDPEIYPTPEPSPVVFVKPAELPSPKSPIPHVTGWPFDGAEAQRRQTGSGLPRELCINAGHSKLEMVLIPAGEFLMGDRNGCADERPLTRVRIEKPFYMSRMEISNAQFREFAPNHDSRTIDAYGKDHVGSGPSVNGPQQPVVRVSWRDALAYCGWLSRGTGRRFALPTEAQWEYACRAGTATPLWFGDVTANFAPFANLADKSLRKGLRTATPWIPTIDDVNDGAVVTRNVGKGTPNPWGLYDMHGNAAEWTLSLYRPCPYRDDDGRNATDGDGERVARGGSFWDRPQRARSSCRRAYTPWQCVFDVGFRVICDAGTPSLGTMTNQQN